MVTRQDLINLLIEVRPILEDKKALQYMEMYPLWQSDLSVKVNERYQYNGRLYKVIQAHTTQADWTPDATPALWTVIDVEHAGTIEDPIPAVAGIEYEYGKHYIDNDVIYICQRTGESVGGKITLYYLPSQLVGQYFEVV